MIRILVSLTATILLTACAAPVTVANVREINEGTLTVVAEMPYDEAYRVIAGESRRCFERAGSGVVVNVRTDLYGESKTAEISVAVASMSTSITLIVFDIRATGPATSEVKGFYRNKISETEVNAMRAWLKGDRTVCRA